jgi:hypothetical protein
VNFAPVRTTADLESLDETQIVEGYTSLHMQAGDILVDDWEKYRDLWIARGGRWVTHVTAEQTISQLRSLGINEKEILMRRRRFRKLI